MGDYFADTGSKGKCRFVVVVVADFIVVTVLLAAVVQREVLTWTRPKNKVELIPYVTQ
jgi:hypothetical protein